MKQIDYFARFRNEVDELFQLTKAKNTDYAGAEDAFHNFRQIEKLTHGRITLEQGILVRLSDKFSRISNLLFKENQVKDESILDTLRDIAVYSIILKIYLEHVNSRPDQVKLPPYTKLEVSKDLEYKINELPKQGQQNQ